MFVEVPHQHSFPNCEQGKQKKTQKLYAKRTCKYMNRLDYINTNIDISMTIHNINETILVLTNIDFLSGLHFPL